MRWWSWLSWRLTGREEELFAALVKKYGPEPIGPNYKSRNESSMRRKSEQPVVAVARDNLHSTRSWGDISSFAQKTISNLKMRFVQNVKINSYSLEF